MNDPHERITEEIYSTLDEAAWKAKRSKSKASHPFIEEALPGAEVMTTLVRSIQTRIGQSLAPSIAATLVESTERQYRRDPSFEVQISEKQSEELREILNELRQNLRSPDYEEELHRVREARVDYNVDQAPQKESFRIDLQIEGTPNQSVFTEYYVNIASPKISQRKIQEMKREALLVEVGNKQAGRGRSKYVIGVYYDTDEGSRHRRSGLNYLERYFGRPDGPDESQWGRGCTVLVGADFWNWLGEDSGTYDMLLKTFKNAGERLEEEHRELFGQRD